MANYVTTADLKADALWRAGEPTDGTSDYDATVLTYLNAMQLGLLLGGPFGPEDEKGIVLPLVDWWWALKNPPGVFNLEAEVNAGTVAIDQGSSTLTFSSPPAASLAGWRVRIAGLPTVPRISTHTGGSPTATLDASWPEVNQTASAFKAFRLEYPLAPDFLRFAGRPSLAASPYKLDVISLEALESDYPLATIAAATVPSRAALIGPALLRVNAWTEQPLRIEYPYIAAPTILTASPDTTPAMPWHHRRMLSTGAAAMILFDKASEKAAALLREVLAGLRAMLQEHRHQMRRMSSGYGSINPRQGQGRLAGPLRTASGLIIGP